MAGWPIPDWNKVMYEWGIMHYRLTDELHRGPMSEAEARTWLDEWDEMSPNAMAGMFYLVRRPVGDWEKV